MRWLWALILLAGCQKAPSVPLSHFSGTAFEIGYHIQVGGELAEAQEEQIAALIQDVFTDIHLTFNHWNPNSELSKLNAHPMLDPFKPSKELLELIQFSSTLNIITQGRFDPAMGHVIEALKENAPTGDYGWHQLHTVDDGLIKGSNIHLDFDGVVKGYAIDKIIMELAKLNLTSVYVEWGGEIRALGEHPAGRPWRVLIKGSDELAINLTDGAIATSGTYEQRYGDKTHIIDPRSGTALNVDHPITSVTVQAPSCALADALATALMVFDNPEDAKAFAEKIKQSLPEIHIWIHCEGNENSDI